MNLRKFWGMILLLLGGCSAQTYHMGLIIPENTPLKEQDIDRGTIAHNITGKDTHEIILFFPSGHPNFQNAVNQALVKGRGDLIINAEVSYIYHWFILGGYEQIKITGDVVRLPQ